MAASAWAGNQPWLLTVYMIVIIALIDSTRVFRLARAVGINSLRGDFGGLFLGMGLFGLLYPPGERGALDICRNKADI